MPAAAAGVEDGDRIVAINGMPVADFAALGELIQKEAAKSPVLGFEVERGIRSIWISRVHAVRQDDGRGASRWVTGIEAPRRARRACCATARSRRSRPRSRKPGTERRGMLKLLGQIVTGHASTQEHLGHHLDRPGRQHDRAHGASAWFLDFLAAVSLSLAVMNLLPIPILDGGHLLYYLIELVKGSPVSERTQVAGQYVGLMLLVALMGLAFYNDILRIAS